MADIGSMIDSMENAIKCRIAADSVRRDDKAERQQAEFEQKLRQADASRIELDNLKGQIKGTDNAAKREQLMMMMMSM